MEGVSIAHAIAFGLCLSIVGGMRAVVPLLVVCLGIRNEWVHAGPTFEWIGSDVALWTLGVAAFAECIIDTIPVVDNFVDLHVAPLLKPIGALLATGSIIPADPTTALIVGAVIGTPAALSWHIPKTKLRLASTATTFGFGNIVLSAAETIAAAVSASLAVVAPYVAAAILVVMVGVLWIIAIVVVTVAKAIAKRAAEQAPAAAAAASQAVRVAGNTSRQAFAYLKARTSGTNRAKESSDSDEKASHS